MRTLGSLAVVRALVVPTVTQGLKIASAAALLIIANAIPANARVVAPDEWFECWPVEVAVFTGRTQVDCQFSILVPLDLPGRILGAPFSDIRFFAVPASDTRLTSSTVTLGQAAITSNRSIWIAFDRLDITGQGYGCRIEDCRPIHGLKLDMVRQEQHAKLQINVSSGDVDDPTSVFSATILLEGSRIPANVVGVRSRSSGFPSSSPSRMARSSPARSAGLTTSNSLLATT